MSTEVWAMVAALVMAAALTDRPERPSPRPVVGAIRWDAWVPDSEWERNLTPVQWRDRLPFYSVVRADGGVEVRGNTQEVIDKELQYAHDAGLDYWAYCYSHPSDSASPSENYGLRLHLASSRKHLMNFALVLMGAAYSGPREQWPTAADELVRLFRDASYQKVLGNRPLVYVYYVESMPGYFGGRPAVKEAIGLLKSKAVAAGLGAPYLVAQVWHPAAGVEAIDEMGFDAIGAYAMIGLQDAAQEQPFARLAAACRAYWESCRETGKQVVPIVMSGWDTRPRQADPARYEAIYQSPPGGPWYTAPTPAELAAHLAEALAWNRRHPEAVPTNAALIYAWNETDEGGWLVPTISEGAARLEAIHGVLSAARKGRSR